MTPPPLPRRRSWRALVLLALALACARPAPPPVSRPAPAPRPITPPIDVPPPVEAPAAPPAPVQPLPPPAPPAVVIPTGPLRVRVGLATDLRSVTLPCCDPRITVELPEGAWPLAGEVRISPAATLTEHPVYRLQVAALKDEEQAQGLAEYLANATGLAADSVFDADTDLYRVRVGRFPRREEAEVNRGRLAALGIGDSWIASEGGNLEDPALFVVRAGVASADPAGTGAARGSEERTVAGRWLDVAAPPDVGIPFDGGRYRGKLLFFVNDRGLLNVVNEVELEDYLRGVVPKEMGPELYDQLEALKAQAVAARTFAVRNLDGFSQEGYDICSTPRCQVYAGMGIEHPISDRAVSETAGQVVLADGELAETFYGATCGGHTENVEVVFPLKHGAYLRGVPCLEAGAAELRGDLRSGVVFPAGLTERLLPATGGARTQALSARLERLALLAALPVPDDRLRSLAPAEVRRFLVSVFDLALDRRLLGSPVDLARLTGEPPADWRPRDARFADFLEASGLLDGADGRELSDAAAEELLFELALYLGVLRHEATRYLSLAEGGLSVRVGDQTRTQRLPGALATFRRTAGELTSASLELMAGDRLDFYWRSDRQGEELLALVQPVAAPHVELGRRAARQRWSRVVSERQLRASVQARYPGFPFSGFEVLSRGVSGRVGKLQLLGSDGRKLMLEGLAIRWTFDLHDTLFWAQPYADGGERGWTFRGRGWGHGVGMCQAGAFGMAVRRNDYRAILQHYYTGIDLGRLKPSPVRPRPAAAP